MTKHPSFNKGVFDIVHYNHQKVIYEHSGAISVIPTGHTIAYKRKGRRYAMKVETKNETS